MKNFTYYRPKTADEAVGLLDAKWGTAELLAGGTDLLDLQKEYIAQPDKVVSVNGIKELLGSESWLSGSPLGDLLRDLVGLLGGGSDSSGTASTTQSDPVNMSSGNMYRGDVTYTSGTLYLEIWKHTNDTWTRLAFKRLGHF